MFYQRSDMRIALMMSLFASGLFALSTNLYADSTPSSNNQAGLEKEPKVGSDAAPQPAEPTPETAKDDDLLNMSIEDLMNVEITTASKKREKVSDAPATVIVISRQQIRDRGYSNLKDVLRDLPGMETINNYFSEVGTLVPVRGVVGNNKIIVLLNGIRVNPPGGEEFPFRSDFSVRSAERIEVVYGPGSTLYGQDAIGAVINVITTEPQPKADVSVGGRVGTENYKEGFASFSDQTQTKAGPVGVTAYIQYQDADLQDFGKRYAGWWTAGRAAAQNVGAGDPPKRWDDGGNALVRVQAGDSSLQLWHRESSRSSSEGGFIPILYFVDEAVWHDRSTVLSGQNSIELSDRWALESTLVFNRYEIDPETRYVWSPDGASLFYNDFKYGLGASYSLEEKLSYDFSDKLSAIAGLTATHYDIIPKATVLGRADRSGDIVSQAGTLTYYTVPGDPTSAVTIPRAYNLTYQDYGFYVEGRYDVMERLRLIAGLREDINTRVDQKPISPRLAAVYRASKEVTGKYLYTQAYVAPAPYYGYNVFDNGTLLNVANPNLQPEKAATHEVNVTYSKKRWLASGSLYFSQQENLIVTETSAPVLGTVWTDPAGTSQRQLTQSANSGSSQATGVDLYLNYSGEFLSPWASYSYVDFESTRAGTTTGLPGISAHNLRLGVTARPAKHLTTTLSGIWRSTPENIANTAGLSSEIQNPYQLDLFVNYDLNKHARLFANVLNLTDHRYALKGMVTPTPQEGILLFFGAEIRY